MYMREMGSVELLTREGEIEIAKRIEDGLKHMIQAISACPTTIAEILALADRIEKDEIRVDEVVDGLVDPTADELAAEDADDEDEEEAEEEGEDEEISEEEQAAIQTADLLRLKGDALKRFAVIRNLYGKMLRALAKNGPRSKAYLQARDQISNELMNIRFGAKQVEALCDGMRRLVEHVRSYEREIMNLSVNKAKMRASISSRNIRARKATCAGPPMKSPHASRGAMRLSALAGDRRTAGRSCSICRNASASRSRI
jgi:RNA polymerase primary sigma factor